MPGCLRSCRCLGSTSARAPLSGPPLQPSLWYQEHRGSPVCHRRAGCQEVVFAIQDILDEEKAAAQAAADAAALEAAARGETTPEAEPEDDTDYDQNETEDEEESDDDENPNP